MYKALVFQLPNKYNDYLSKIFYNINVKMYIWNICSYEIVRFDNKHNENGDSFFKHEILNGHEFGDAIKQYNYYIVSLDIKAYKDKKYITYIYNYEEFCQNSCEFVLFFDDGEFVELYCKDNFLLEMVQKNLNNFFEHDITKLKILKNEKEISELFNAHY